MLVYFKYDLEIPIGEIDSNGKAPIHLAIEKGKEALVVLLISWGADLEMKDKENNTLLHYAAITNNFRLAKLLIIRGANRKSYNSEGKSPYTLAEEQGYTDILRILVKFT